MDTNLFDDLVYRTHAVPDRKRIEYHISCPACGHESSPKKPHCSFNEKGFFCFVCGAKGSLQHLATLLGLETGKQVTYYTPARKESETTQKRPFWESCAEDLIRNFESHPGRLPAWNAYKMLPEEVIRQKRLGLGVLPSSRCAHDRLIVPVIDADSRIVGVRGRAIACDCGKWLQAGGTKLEQMPLYNQDSMGLGQVVMIVENPVDALMVSAYTAYTGVATYSVAYWRDGWTEAIRSAKPELVAVAFDNDLPGNGGGHRHGELVKRWFVDHPKATMIPESAGPRLANRLLEIGLPVSLFNWPDGVKDIGQMLSNISLRETVK